MQIKKRPSMLRTAELVDACAGSWIGSMKRRSIRGFLMIAVIFLLAGCSSARPIPFQNTSHREIYSLNLGDLEKLQFYISGDVVAQYQDATGTKSLLLPGLTPGVATGGTRSSKRFRICPSSLFFTREFGTKWSPEPMLSCSSTGTVGKDSSRNAKSPRGGELGIDNQCSRRCQLLDTREACHGGANHDQRKKAPGGPVCGSVFESVGCARS